MAEPFFSEKRTRSQLTLPDNILQIPDLSPLKGARTALRNHIVADATPSSSKTSEESDDELLLSPGKKAAMIKSSNPKRSASPPLLDEYSLPSRSPLDGRELKRVKRDGLPEGEAEGEMDFPKATLQLHQRLTTGHSRYQSESSIIAGRHSARKGTDSKKPVSTHSVSPPLTTFSPAPNPPKMVRAQSVPIFPEASPWIDLTKPPPSPKRRRSPSRSPSKERAPKLRITSAGSFGPPKLPTIHDDVVMDVVVHSASESSLPQECGTRSILPGDPPSASREEIVPASPPSREMVPASPPTKETAFPSPSSPRTREIIPASPTPPPPSNATNLAAPMTLVKPSTPITQPLSTLISMSPLTPLPETPTPPPRRMSNSGFDDRYENGVGWGIPMKELKQPAESAKPKSTIPPSASQTRLPRLAMGAPSVPISKLMPAAMGPPAAPASKKSNASAGGMQASTSLPRNAFEALFNGQRDKSAKEKDKAADKRKKQQIRASAKPQKAKEKMRRREKPEIKKALIVPLPDEEEEEERVETAATGIVESSSKDTPLTGASFELPAVLTETEDTNMTIETSDTHPTEEQFVNARMVEDGAMQEPEDNAALSVVLSELSQPGPSTSAEDITDEVPVNKEIQEAEPLAEPSVPVDTEATEPDAAKEDLPDTTGPRPLSRAGKSRLPIGKKRHPVSAQPGRVTRSSSNRRVYPTAESSKTAIEAHRKPALRPVPAATKKVAVGPAKKSAPAPVTTVGTKDIESREDVPMDTTEEQELPLPPGSPMRTTPRKSPPKALSAGNKDEQAPHVPAGSLLSATTPIRVSLKDSSPSPSPSPSPTKIARSTLMAMRPTAASIARTFSNKLSNAPNSSLSTLSNALEKLRMPPPARPSTSMGFNRDAGSDDNDAQVLARSKDDATVGRASIGMGRAGSSGIQRSVTLDSIKPRSSTGPAIASKPPAAASKILVQKPLSMFMSSKGNMAKPGGMAMGAGARRMGLASGKPLFGVGGGMRRTISKKSTLPVVIGSPAKGGKSIDESMKEYSEAATEEGEEEEGGNIYNAIINGGSAAQLVENMLAEGSEKGKEKECTTSSRPVHSSRRVSMLSRDLTYSLNALPPAAPAAGSSSGAKGSMGPPPTPPSGSRSARGTGSSPSSSPSQSGRAGATRSSARIAKIAPPAMKAKATNESNTSTESPNPAAEALKVLKDCVIFVDVKTEDGDEAGSLFVEMLESVGARVLTRVGQTCTHIVYKNGLMSTITRWKLLRDPKPFVVGIGWVVECIEQRKQVDETEFLIDLTHTNVAGTHKRRRSMLPKLFGEEEPEKEESVDGDRSLDGSVSSITMDDDLTPLERARRRKRC